MDENKGVSSSKMSRMSEGPTPRTDLPSALGLVLTYNWKSEIMKILITCYCKVPGSEFTILETLTILVLLVSGIFQIVTLKNNAKYF